MLKEMCLPQILKALDHEGEKRNHQWHEVLERARGIENIRPHMFTAQQVQSNECSTRE